MSRALRLPAVSALLLTLAACGGDGGVTEPTGQPGIRIVAGAGVSDTIGTRPVQSLLVEVRRPDGSLARGSVVRFEGFASSDTARPGQQFVRVRPCAIRQPDCVNSFGAPVTIDSTDANGIARTLVTFGDVSGTARLRIIVPDLGLIDSATYTILPGAATSVRASSPTLSIVAGQSVVARGRVLDRAGNVRSDMATMTADAGSNITVESGTATVTAQSFGTQRFFTRFGTLADTTSVQVVPAGRLLLWSANDGTILLTNTDGSARTPARSTGARSDFGTFPKLSPDGLRFIHHTGNGPFGGNPSVVVIADTSGANRREIAGEFTTIVATRLLADGTALVVARRAGEPSSAPLSLWRVSPTNTVTLAVVLPGLGSGELYGAADISPDGTRVSYVSTGSNFMTELRLLTVATGAVATLVSGARAPRFSPLGDRIAYLNVGGSFGGSGTDGVPTLINVDGSSRRTLGSALVSAGLAWSPDGVYVMGRNAGDGGTGLRVIRISDVASIVMRLSANFFPDLYQPDWR